MQELPRNQFGYWLEVPIDHPEDDRAVKRIVLRQFKHLIQRYLYDGLRPHVREFRWYVKNYKNAGFPDDVGRTYGWKCLIHNIP